MVRALNVLVLGCVLLVVGAIFVFLTSWALAAAGFVLACVRRRAPWLLLVVVLYFNGIHAVVVSTFRYCVPVMPLVLIPAAYLLAEAWSAWRLRRVASEVAHG